MQLLKSGSSGNDAEMEEAWNRIGDHYAERHNWEEAVRKMNFRRNREGKDTLLIAYPGPVLRKGPEHRDAGAVLLLPGGLLQPGGPAGPYAAGRPSAGPPGHNVLLCGHGQAGGGRLHQARQHLIRHRHLRQPQPVARRSGAGHQAQPAHAGLIAPRKVRAAPTRRK